MSKKKEIYLYALAWSRLSVDIVRKGDADWLVDRFAVSPRFRSSTLLPLLIDSAS